MLLQVAGEGSRPTFFEMVAADSLPATLKSAITYALGVRSKAAKLTLMLLFVAARE